MLTQINKRTMAVAGAAVLVLCLTSTALRADDGALYTKTLKATAWVSVPGVSHGTCWVIDREERLLITNKHVVGTATDVEITFPLFRDRQLVTALSEYQGQYQLKVQGKVIARDAKRDLALIQVNSLPDGVSGLALAKSSAKNNDVVMSIGNSGLGDLQPTLWRMRTGKVARKSFQQLHYGAINQTLETSIIDSNLNIRGGDSGGPVVNQNGELVGVNTGYNNLTQVSFTVDVTEVRDFLVKTQDAGRRPSLGGPILTGTWTQTRIDNNGVKIYAGWTLRSNGTLLFEDSNGQSFDGSFHCDGGQLTLIVPGLGLTVTSDVEWQHNDMFSVRRDGILYTMQRR